MVLKGINIFMISFKQEVNKSLNCLSSLILSVPFTDYYTLDSYSNFYKNAVFKFIKKYL